MCFTPPHDFLLALPSTYTWLQLIDDDDDAVAIVAVVVDDDHDGGAILINRRWHIKINLQQHQNTFQT